MKQRNFNHCRKLLGKISLSTKGGLKGMIEPIRLSVTQRTHSSRNR